VILIIDVLRKIITLDYGQLNVESQDLSWIPSNVVNVTWYESEGQIHYIDNENQHLYMEYITELGIYEQAIDIFNNEKQRLKDERIAEEEAKEAARDYWAELRILRDQKLFDCDWTQVSDSPLTVEQKTAWKMYRQQLRDLPKNTSDPKNPVWPVEPTT
jgi:hypothetical protein